MFRGTYWYNDNGLRAKIQHTRDKLLVKLLIVFLTFNKFRFRNIFL